MTASQKSLQTCDRCAILSLALGVLVAIITGITHYQIITSSHFDFVIHDTEFSLVLGMIIIAAILSLIDLREGFNAVNRLNEPHLKTAKPLAIAGISLGMAGILPAAIILVIMIETLLLKFISLHAFFEY